MTTMLDILIIENLAGKTFKILMAFRRMLQSNKRKSHQASFQSKTYFGLLPEWRGKGLSTSLHLHSLYALKEMGATHYIGSTHITNKKMQRVFEKNACMKKSLTESYYKYFSK